MKRKIKTIYFETLNEGKRISDMLPAEMSFTQIGEKIGVSKAVAKNLCYQALGKMSREFKKLEL
jgi:DNA-directed RNA polymerase specialized sigma subunit